MADRMTPEEAADYLRGLVGADPDASVRVNLEQVWCDEHDQEIRRTHDTVDFVAPDRDEIYAKVAAALRAVRERDQAQDVEADLRRFRRLWRRRSWWRLVWRGPGRRTAGQEWDALREVREAQLQLYAGVDAATWEADEAWVEGAVARVQRDRERSWWRRLAVQILAVLSRRTPAFRRGHDDPPVSSGDG